MKKMFTYIGISTLVCLSFIITEKTTTVVKENDTLYQQIIEKKEKYTQPATDAIINNNTMIPGLNGWEIDIEKTYDEMKKINTFNEKLIKYKPIYPTISSKQNYTNTIIQGNPKKNMISLIFYVKQNDDITPILEKINDTKVTFFIDSNWFTENNEQVINLIKQGHTIGNLSSNLNYRDTNYIWMHNILKKIGKQTINYCYDTNNNENIKECALQKNYTIKPNIIVKQNPLKEIKEKIKPGSLIQLDINQKTIQELPTIINYIKQKGYTLENLTNHLSENLN